MKYFFHIVDITANAYLPLKCLKGIVLCMFSQRLDLFYIKLFYRFLVASFITNTSKMTDSFLRSTDVLGIFEILSWVQ